MDNDTSLDTRDARDTSPELLPATTSSPPGESPPGESPAEGKPAARLRTLSNGAVLNEDTGKIVAMHPELNPHAITKETTQLMHQKRRETTRKRILAGLRDGLAVGNWAEAIQVMASAQAKLAADPGRGRAATYAFRTILESASLWPEKQAGETPAGGISIQIGAEAAEKLLFALSRRGE